MRWPTGRATERWRPVALFLSCYENIRLLFHNKFVFFEEVSFYVQVMRCLGSKFNTAPF